MNKNPGSGYIPNTSININFPMYMPYPPQSMPNNSSMNYNMQNRYNMPPIMSPHPYGMGYPYYPPASGQQNQNQNQNNMHKKSEYHQHK
jgi:hypothetical protein